MKSTQNYFTDSIVLWSAIEHDLASRLLKEINNKAVGMKNEEVALIDERLITLNPYVKLDYIQRYYDDQKLKQSPNPELHFNTSDFLNHDHYSHKLSSLISGRLKHIKFSSTSYFKNDDQRQMMEFVNLYHEFILNIIRTINEHASSAGNELKHDTSGGRLSSQLAGIINVITEYQKIYNGIGYGFEEDYDNEINESFEFLSRQLSRELEKIEIKDDRPFQQRIRPTLQKLTDYLETLKKCSEELLAELNHHVIGLLIPEKEKVEIQEALAISYLLDETKARITSLEGEYLKLEPGKMFSLRANCDRKYLERLHDKLFRGGYVASDIETFIDFFIKDEIITQLNWTGTYLELWCFLQCMFIVAIENPYFYFSTIDQWTGYVNITKKDRIAFSGWLNDILYNRIKISGGIFDTDKMKDIKSKQITKRIKIRNDFFQLISK